MPTFKDVFLESFKQASLANVSAAEKVLDCLTAHVMNDFNKPVHEVKEEADFNGFCPRGVKVTVQEVKDETGVEVTPMIVKLLLETSNVYNISLNFTNPDKGNPAYFLVMPPHLSQCITRDDLNSSKIRLHNDNCF